MSAPTPSIVEPSALGTTPGHSEAPPLARIGSSSEQRTSTLVGDRVCIKCGYNLVGQAILREPHYNMLIVRCPECATVASVQEYPLLGRWANRWAAFFAALWLLLIVGMWVGSSMALFGFTVGSGEMASEQYGDFLYTQFNQWQNQQTAAPTGAGAAAATGAAAGTITITRPGGRVTVVGGGIGPGAGFTAWWNQQDHAALLRSAGGVFAGFNVFVWYLWAWEALVMLCIGALWAAVLIGRHRGGMLVWGLIIILGAAALSLIPLLDWMASAPVWTYQVSRRQVAPPIMGLALLWGALWLFAGLMIGRPAARGMIRMLLPPRLRTSLTFLWLADGLPPPRLH